MSSNFCYLPTYLPTYLKEYGTEDGPAGPDAGAGPFLVELGGELLVDELLGDGQGVLQEERGQAEVQGLCGERVATTGQGVGKRMSCIYFTYRNG